MSVQLNIIYAGEDFEGIYSRLLRVVLDKMEVLTILTCMSQVNNFQGFLE